MCPRKAKETTSTPKSQQKESQLTRIQSISSYMDELRVFIDKIPSGTGLREEPEIVVKKERRREEVRERHREKGGKQLAAGEQAAERKPTGNYRLPPYY